MARYYSSKKGEADGLKKISVFFLRKHDYFCGWKPGTITWTNGFTENKSSVDIAVSTTAGERYLKLKYTQTAYDGERKDFDYKVWLTDTRCHFGGKRYWFICPLSVNGNYCGRRVAVLYLGGGYFGCRHCYNLTYESRNESRGAKFELLFKAITERDKIDKLKEEIKRNSYRGRPTKKQIRLFKLYDKYFAVSEVLNSKKYLDLTK